MTISNRNKNARRDGLRLFQKGVQTHLLPLKTITVDGVVRQVADILTMIDSDIADTDQADTARAVWLQSVAVQNTSHATLDPIILGTKQFVLSQFGSGPAAQTTLADFGLTPTKKAEVSPATKVAAAKKSRATRTLLNTMGSTQKKEAIAKAAQAPAQTGSTPVASPVAGSTTTATPTK